MSLTTKKSKGEEDTPADAGAPAADAAKAPAADAAKAPAADGAKAPAADAGAAKDAGKDAAAGEEKKEEKKESTDEAKAEAAEKLTEAETAVRIARFKEIAKTKVGDLIKKHGDLDKHLKEQYANLEKIL